jgi:hypothetical protein
MIHGIYGKKSKGRIRKIGTYHKFRKSQIGMYRRRKKTLKFDGGEEIQQK